jgi:hypothetical protein
MLGTIMLGLLALALAKIGRGIIDGKKRHINLH